MVVSLKVAMVAVVDVSCFGACFAVMVSFPDGGIPIVVVFEEGFPAATKQTQDPSSVRSGRFLRSELFALLVASFTWRLAGSTSDAKMSTSTSFAYNLRM